VLKRAFLRVMLTPIPVVYDEMHFIKVNGVVDSIVHYICY